MTADFTITASLLCNRNLLHFLLEQRLDGVVPPDLPDIDNMSYGEACKRYAADAFRQETKQLSNEAFLFRWEYFCQLYPRNQETEIVLAALRCLYDDFLEERNGSIHVKLARYGEWQNLMANINMGPIAAYAAHRAGKRCTTWGVKERERVRTSMLLSDALCYPHDILVEDYIREHGLNDTHLHIKACIFSEYNWLCALSDPEHAFNPFSWKDGTSQKEPIMLRAIRQQFCDIYGRSPAMTIPRHLRIARNLRTMLREYAGLKPTERTHPRFSSLRAWVYDKTQKYPGNRFPDTPQKTDNSESLGCLIDCIDDLGKEEIAAELIDHWEFREEYADLIREERDWMSRLIHILSEEDFTGQGNWLLPCFHVYLLLMNEYCGLFIQRETQKGFDQFNNTERLEVPNKKDSQYYLECFRRFHGNHPESDVHHLDARFAPKKTIDAYLKQFSHMLGGYARYLKELREKHPHAGALTEHQEEMLESLPYEKPRLLLEWINELRPKPPFRYLRLGMTIHFIKNEWKRKKDAEMRYDSIRKALRSQQKTLQGLLLQVPELTEFVRAVDAANDESNVPPSVFAPCFRFCRNELGMERVTFHCGEAFPHLLTGLRAMDDARRLLELKEGDRIGHGTALGMDPTYWREQHGDAVYLRKEERMLDLLYAYGILKQEYRVPGQTCAALQDELMNLAHEIFPAEDYQIDPHILKAAMDMRSLCPFLLENIFPARKQPKEWSGRVHLIREFKGDYKTYFKKLGIEYLEDDAEWRRTIEKLRQAPTYAILLLLDWQFTPQTWLIGGQIKRVELHREDDELLLILQRRMMQDYINDKIIIETLITSNLRIACYRRAVEHHAMRWLLHHPEKFKEEPNLLLCFGSDDPAIFSCDAKTDFYLLYACLHELGVREQEALQLLDRLNKRGRIYSFPVPTGPISAE